MLIQKRLILGSLLMVFFYNALIYGKKAGISFPIIIAGAIFFLLYLLKIKNKLNRDYYWLIAIPILLLSIRASASDNYFF